MAEQTVQEAVAKARAMIDAVMPRLLTIVRHEHMAPGMAWKVLDHDHLYFFMHPADVDSLPHRVGSPGLAGVPVRDFDDEMRAIFVSHLDRMAAREAGFASDHWNDRGT